MKSSAKEAGKEILSLSKTVALACAAGIVINTAAVVNAKIPSGSMMNTIKPGDRLFANRLAYINEDPNRFDVIVFQNPDDENIKYVKRIIGLPNETVNVLDGKVYINDSDTPLDDSFIYEEMKGSYGPFAVPKNAYFVLGDNRNNSRDSRAWNNPFVDKEKILGKAVMVYWPPEHIGLVR